MSTALQQTQAPENLAAILRRPEYSSRFKEVLGEKCGQFISSVLSVGATMPDVEPRSIISAAMIAASLDLPVNKNLGFAWIVPYMANGRKLGQFQMGYKGFVQLALRTGTYSRMNVRSVNVEAFDGYDDVGEPRIAWDRIDETKEAVGYVFAWKLTNGFTKVCYWSKAAVEEHAKRYSQSYRGGKNSPWQTHFDAMAKKTVVKNELSRWGVLSIQFQQAIEADQAAEADGNVSYVDSPSSEEPKEAASAKPPLPPLPNQSPSKAKAEAAAVKAAAPEPPKPEPPKEAPTPLVNPAPTAPPPTPEPPQQEPEPEPMPAAAEAEAAPEPEQPAPDPKTAQEAIGVFLDKNAVSFEDFRAWLVNAGHYKDAMSMATVGDLPMSVCRALAEDEKKLGRLVKLYGTPKP